MIYYGRCHAHSGNGREVILIETLYTLIVSIVAGIISYYICKWLDGNDK